MNDACGAGQYMPYFAVCPEEGRNECAKLCFKKTECESLISFLSFISHYRKVKLCKGMGKHFMDRQEVHNKMTNFLHFCNMKQNKMIHISENYSVLRVHPRKCDRTRNWPQDLSRLGWLYIGVDSNQFQHENRIAIPLFLGIASR